MGEEGREQQRQHERHQPRKHIAQLEGEESRVSQANSCAPSAALRRVRRTTARPRRTVTGPPPLRPPKPSGPCPTLSSSSAPPPLRLLRTLLQAASAKRAQCIPCRRAVARHRHRLSVPSFLCIRSQPPCLCRQLAPPLPCKHAAFEIPDDICVLRSVLHFVPTRLSDE